jgi:transcriptional regulator with XRE-family HTH domain
MKFDKIESSEDEFGSLFEFDNQEDKISHKAHMISFRFLSEIEKTIDSNISRKALSKLIGTSPSYITQLFRGDKLVNLMTLAKLEDVFESEFDIVFRKNSEKKQDSISNPASFNNPTFFDYKIASMSSIRSNSINGSRRIAKKQLVIKTTIVKPLDGNPQIYSTLENAV